MKYEAPEIDTVLFSAKEALALIEDQERETPDVLISDGDIDVPLD